MPRDWTGNCVLCPGRPPQPRAFLDAIQVCGGLLDGGCPPALLPELLCEFESNRLHQSRHALARLAIGRGLLWRRMASVIA